MRSQVPWTFRQAKKGYWATVAVDGEQLVAASHDDDTGLVGCTSPPSAYFGVGGAVLQVSPRYVHKGEAILFKIV